MPWVISIVRLVSRVGPAFVIDHLRMHRTPARCVAFRLVPTSGAGTAFTVSFKFEGHLGALLVVAVLLVLDLVDLRILHLLEDMQMH